MPSPFESLSTSSRALAYFVLLGIVMGVQGNLAKALTSTFKASFITFMRCVAFILALPFVEWDDVDKHCTLRDLLLYITASAILVVSFATMNFSYMFLGAGDSNAIEFGGQLIFTAIVGHLVLKEKISLLYSGLLVLNCAGVVMVAKPDLIFGVGQVALASREIGAIITLSGACFGTAWIILMRQVALRDTLYCFTMTAISGLVGMAMTGLWCTLESGWRTPTTWLSVCLFILYGVSSTIQCVFSFEVIQQATAKDFAVAMTISVVISYILQITFFGEEVDVVRIAGAVLIMVCVFVSALWTQLTSMWQTYLHSGDVESSPDDEEVASLMTQDEENEP